MSNKEATTLGKCEITLNEESGKYTVKLYDGYVKVYDLNEEEAVQLLKKALANYYEEWQLKVFKGLIKAAERGSVELVNSNRTFHSVEVKNRAGKNFGGLCYVVDQLCRNKQVALGKYTFEAIAEVLNGECPFEPSF